MLHHTTPLHPEGLLPSLHASCLQTKHPQQQQKLIHPLHLLFNNIFATINLQ